MWVCQNEWARNCYFDLSVHLTNFFISRMKKTRLDPYKVLFNPYKIIFDIDRCKTGRNSNKQDRPFLLDRGPSTLNKYEQGKFGGNLYNNLTGSSKVLKSYPQPMQTMEDILWKKNHQQGRPCTKGKQNGRK